jgi:hypothetical protein
LGHSVGYELAQQGEFFLGQFRKFDHGVFHIEILNRFSRTDCWPVSFSDPTLTETARVTG